MPKPFSAIPGPKGWPLIGSLLDYSRFGRYSFERLHVAKRENMAMYGKIYKERMGRLIVNLFDPADIEAVYRAEGKYPTRPELPMLVTACKRDKEPIAIGSLNGEPWWRLRRAVHQTMMTPEAAHVYLPVQNQVANDFVRLLSRKLDEGSGKLEEDITTLLAKYTLEVLWSRDLTHLLCEDLCNFSLHEGFFPSAFAHAIVHPLLKKPSLDPDDLSIKAFGAVCFNVRIGCLEPLLPSGSDALRTISTVDKAFESFQQTLYAFPWFIVYRTRLYRQFIDATKSFQRMTQPYVDKALMSDEVDVNGKKVKTTNFLRTLVDNNSERLANWEMTKMSCDLLGAGIHSTAYALSFCLYNLAKNVDKQDHLLSEIDSVLDRTSCPPVTPEVLNRMRYLKACVKESFRLNFPIESGSFRTLPTDLVLSDYLVPKGTLVSMNFQTMCLLEEYFEHADRYLPERWMKGEGEGDTSKPASKFIMLPFGYGLRTCIGRRFAEQEIWLALIKILQRFRLQLDVDASEHRPIGIINRIFSMPDARIPVKFIPR